MLSCFQCSSNPMGHSRLYKGPSGAKQLVTVGYTHTDKKNLCKPRTKPEIPAECARLYAYKHTHTHTHTHTNYAM